MMKTNIKRVTTSCNNCGSSESEFVTDGVEHEYDNTTSDTFTVVRCTQCGLAYLSPRPDISELSTIYPPNYYAYQIEETYDEKQRNNIYFKMRYAGIMATLEATLKRYFPGQKEVKMLDIGCGDGHVLNCFKKVRTHLVETHGVDLGEAAVEQARAQGHNAVAGRFEDVELPEGYFDFVFASHVIEHVPDPKAFTEKVYRILKPGGVFGFWTPNIDSVEAKWFQKQHWGQYHFPRHWVFYSPKSVRHLAELTGFEVLDIDFAPNGVSWVFTFHSVLKHNPRLAKYADRLFPTLGWHTTTPINFVRNGFFVGVEILLKLFTGRTSNMGVAFRKPS